MTEPMLAVFARDRTSGVVNSSDGGMALLMHDELRTCEDQRSAALDFLESAYLAGAKRADWDIDGYKLRPLQ